MILRDANTSDGPLFEKWFSHDEAGLRFLGSYRDLDQTLKLVGKHRKLWLAYEDDIPVGFLDLEVNGTRGDSSIYVAPDQRRKGFSLKLHVALAEQARKLGVTDLFGYVELENEPSIRALEKAGYTKSPDLDKDGLLEYSLKISQ